MPSGLPNEQREQFDRAVGTFRGVGAVRVAPEKISSYLEHTKEIKVPPSQRLRWLAIALEHDMFERGWESLRAIYQAAATAEPMDPFILHSWGLSASHWVATLPGETVSPEKKAVAAEAEHVLLAALELAPRDSRIAHALGLLFYEHPCSAEDPEGYLGRALEWFTRAVEWDPENVIAQLYVAHCYDDGKDWPRAVAEYEKVNLDHLARRWPAWRAVKCREQLARCYACAGNTTEAIRRFSAFLDDAETWDEDRVVDSIINLHELVAAGTQKLGDLEVLRRTRELVKRLAKNPRMHWLEGRYQQLFST